jgi:hypothetical protein
LRQYIANLGLAYIILGVVSVFAIVVLVNPDVVEAFAGGADAGGGAHRGTVNR